MRRKRLLQRFVVRALAAPAMLLLSAAMFSISLALAQDWQLPKETQKFKPGPGAELATSNCLLCHSADYVSTQPPLTRTAWKATVEKMRIKYGAPIVTNKLDELVDYLTVTYGIRAKSQAHD